MKKTLVASSVTLFLIGCGGSSDSDNTRPVNLPAKLTGQIQRVSDNQQTITVNGYTASTEHAAIGYQDDVFNLNDLAPGMRIKATSQGDTFSTIEMDPSITGAISHIDGNNFIVNNIELNSANGLAGLAVGDWVMVTTYHHADGSTEVTSVRKVPQTISVELEGKVTDLTSTHFKINNVTVDYSNADIDQNDVLADGVWVEAFGQFINGNLIAERVEIEDEGDYHKAELEGVITWVNNTFTRVELNGRIQFNVDGNTEFDDGNRQELASGRWIEVELSERSNGLYADEVEFGSNQGIKGKEFTVEGYASIIDNELSINGIVISTDSNTEFDDGLTLDNLHEVWVEAEGNYVSADNRFVAKEIESEDKESTIKLEGQVKDYSLWGYEASDNSLSSYNGKWIEADCDFDGSNISNCKLDD